MNEPFLVHANRLDIGASIGITVFPDDTDDPDRLLRNADIALYHAKRGGRAQYQCYSLAMDQELKATCSLEAGLRRALDDGTLELFYQPLYALGDDRIQGVEALIRWPHPGGGYVLPGSFIPVAETSGVIVPLAPQLAFLRDHTCDEVQGYLIARPGAVGQIERMFGQQLLVSRPVPVPPGRRCQEPRDVDAD